MRPLQITSRLTNRENLAFNQYLKEVSKIEKLTPSEEIELTKKVREGDEAALEELVTKNLRFVVSVAKQYANGQNPLPDLVNEGNIGLITAAKRFDPDSGFKFISYAVWWIRKVILEHITNHGRLVRLPANKMNSLSKLDKLTNQLEQKLSRHVTIVDILDEYADTELKDEKNKRDYEALIALNLYHMDSLDRDITGAENDGISLGETLSDETIFKPTDHDIVLNDIKNGLSTVLDTLKPRDRYIISSLYGLDGQIPRTLKDLGDELGITREMVRQVKEKSLLKLRKKLQNSELKF